MLLFHPRALRPAASSRLCINCLRYKSTLSSSTPQVVFSGIQPTGVPHLGNYLGALREWVKLQNSTPEGTTRLFSIVDLHAITIKQNAVGLKKYRKDMLASLMAVGLTPEKSLLFCQSSVPQHAELMWILSCNASMGYLWRMTQWKSKLNLPTDASPFDIPPSSNSRDAFRLGLFSYPVLQAADILLYGTTHVPVGEDQAQHLEFTREIANGFNYSFGPLFIPPETILSPAKRVMSLKHPTKKMSKSEESPSSRILITDSKEAIQKKIKAALTDSIEGVSYDPVARPGVSNLIHLMYFMDETIAHSPEELALDMKDLSIRALKEKVTDVLDANIKDIRERYQDIMASDEKSNFLADINEESAAKARKMADVNLEKIKRAMGLDSV